MYWETLPNGVWIIYYSFLIVTLGTALLSVIRKKMISLSIIAIALTMTVPIIGLINSIGRAKGLNEFEHIVSQLQQGSIWSIYTFIGFLYLLIWWAIFLFKNKWKNFKTG